VWHGTLGAAEHGPLEKLPVESRNQVPVPCPGIVGRNFHPVGHRSHPVDRFETVHIQLVLLYKASNSLWSTCLNGIGHFSNSFLIDNGILPQLTIKFWNISVKVGKNYNITDRFFFLTTRRSISSSSSSSTFRDS
jgi:hypothetical protein